MKNRIKKLSLSAVFSALIAAINVLGTFIEVLDITAAAFCSFCVFIVLIEAGEKYPFLVYLTSSVLLLIFVPYSSSTLYFIGFFGYYPILRTRFSGKSKRISKLICTVVFNAITLLMLILFKSLFGMQNEPVFIYLLLIAAYNLFFLCFDKAIDLFIFVYVKRLRNKIKFIK